MRRCVFGALLLLAGCAGSGANRAELIPESTAVIRVQDSGLQDDVELVSGRAYYESDLLIAEVQLRSNASGEERVSYRFSWHHRDESDHEGAWQALVLAGGEERTVSERASEPNVASSVFELRRAGAE